MLRSLRASVPRVVQGRAWSTHVPWRVHDQVDRFALRHAYDREPGPTWTFRPQTPDATLLFGGDFALHRWQPDDSAARVFEGVHDVFAAADFRVVNIETVLSDHAEPSGQVGSFLKAAPSSIACLQHLGIDAVTVANNHALDFGSRGLSESIEHLRSGGIAVCGVDVPDAVTKVTGATVHGVKGLRVGMIAATDHFGGAREPDGMSPVWLDTAALRSAVQVLKASCTIVVVQLHWGYEHVMYPLRWHRDFARELVDLGADIVCCHHAHVVMGVERWNAGIIAHGLGNFWFGTKGRNHPASRFGILLRVTVDRSGVVTAEVVPVSTELDRTIRVEELCMPGFGRLCDEVQSDRTVDRVEMSRMTMEIASLLRDVGRRIAARDIAGLLERQSYLAAPRHDWLLERAGQASDRELREAAEWLRYFRGAARDIVQRLELTPPPALTDIDRRSDGRGLYGRWP